jgi:serine/threonine protein kinase
MAQGEAERQQARSAWKTDRDNTQNQDEASYDLLNYRLQSRIGQEELATSYRASHLTLDRPVQVHILRRTDWISISRFQLAARLAAKLSHPNLLPVIDAGHDEQYGDYIVTPLIEARMLSEVLEQHAPLDPMLVLRVATQLAGVLDYLHAQQVIHRDVQPANILLTAEGVAYLSNLSLAASPDTPDFSSIDEADYLTPYSAPEQRLDQAEATVALDIYSLGAVVYHMFSGEVPPAPGSDLPVLASRNTALTEVDPVIQRMLLVQPEARYPTAGDAVAALRRAMRIVIDLSTEDMQESHWEPAAEWLENPLETVMGDELDAAFIRESRARADRLHRSEEIRRLLNRWSREGFFRRSALGHIMQLEQMVSYNIYFYELHTYNEKRIPLQPRRTPQKSGEERSDVLPMLPLWDVSMPEVEPFTAVSEQEVVWPHSRRVITCPECSGVGKIHCKTCKGQGEVEKNRKVPRGEDPSASESVREVCPTCHGYRQVVCPICEGKCNLVEEQVFQWSRMAYAWKNKDDLEGLPRLALQKRLQEVYKAQINLYDDRWHSVAPLGELLREAVADAGNDTRILLAELNISGVPLTEIDYRLDEGAPVNRLYVVGFDEDVVGSWVLLNPERVILAVVVALVLLAIVGVVVGVVV